MMFRDDSKESANRLIRQTFTKFILMVGMVLAMGMAAQGATVNVNSSTVWSALAGGSGPGGAPNSSDGIVIAGGATLTVDVVNGQCASLQIGGTTVLSGDGTVTFQSGSQVACAGGVILGNGARSGSLNFADGGLLQIGGAVTVNALDTFTPGTGTIEYNNSGAQTVVNTLGAYNDLKVSGGNTKTLGGGITVNGDLTIESGTTLAVSGSNFPIAVGGNWTNNSGTFTAGTGIVRLTGAGAQSIGGSAATVFSALTINKAGGTATANTNFTVTTVFTNLAGTFNASSQTITLSAAGTPLVISGGTFNAAASTIAYTSTSGATVAGGLTYFNLTTAGNSGGDTFTPNADFTVAGVWNIGRGTFNGSSRIITVSAPGTPVTVSNGTFTAATSTVLYTSGSGAAVTALTYNNLGINGGGTFTLANTTTVNGALTLSNGVLATGTNTLVVAAGGSVSGGNAGSYVNGNLQKAFNTGSGQSFTFPLGDGVNFAPINLASLNVTSAGSLTAKATVGDHPLLAGSPINVYLNVNRYWTLTNSPTGIVLATNAATFNFVGVGTDVDVGAVPATFMACRYNNGNWSTNTIGSRTATNIMVSGLTAFGDFAIGTLTGGGPQSFTTNTTYFTYTNRAEFLADGWDFIARTTNGLPRDTETTNGISPPDVAFARTNATLGTVLRIPVNTGDLWAGANNTRNSLFRDLPSNWSSVRLQLSFAPTQPFQQALLALYQNDNNYLEVGSAYTFPTNPIIAFSQETNGSPRTVASVALSITNLHLRLDRDVTYGIISAFYSLDDTNWTALGQTDQDLVSPRLCIWAGVSQGGFPNADLYRLQIITSDSPVITTLGFQRPTFVFNAVAGQACTNLQRVMVVRRGPLSLHWTLTNTAPWLSTSAISGDTPSAFDLAVDTTGLTPGIYETALQFGASGAANSPAALNVKLIVNPDVRAQTATWRGGKRSAMTVWIDDSLSSMFTILTNSGYRGTYLLWGVDETHLIGSFFTNYYNVGMELGAHTVQHRCFLLDERQLRWDVETNRHDILARTPAQPEQLITFAFPCGLTTPKYEAIVTDYYLMTRGYNINQLEDPSPYDWMFVKSFNSHENDATVFNPTAPPNPADFKTVVDAAIAQGKWANLVFHGLNNDDGAVAYSVGKDIWVAPGGTVTRYILQRDRTIISNYVESSGLIRFDTARLAIDASSVRSFETAFTTNDLVTFKVDVSGTTAVTNLTVGGVSTTNYTIRTVNGVATLFFDTLLTATAKRIELGVIAGTNQPPVLATNANVTINEGQSLVITNTAMDPDTNALTFSLGANAPAGMTLSTNGILNWTPGEAAGGSNYTITVVVTDHGLPVLSASNSFMVTVNEINVAPVLPPQSNRIMAPAPLTVVNTASDADVPVNPRGYRLIAGPTNAAISATGIITWTPTLQQVPSTNTFTTVVTDTNVTAVNAQNLSATNSFIVAVVDNLLLLPAQTNRTIDALTLLVVTNTATHLGILTNTEVMTNTYIFNYMNRTELLDEGWDFIARTTNGLPRDTERTNGAVVSYDQVGHPGTLRIPVDGGDLWATANNSRNGLFLNISSNWTSARLNLTFTPAQDFQQVQLGLYQNDDNYVQVGFGYNSGLGGQVTTLIREVNGSPALVGSKPVATTNILLRLDRDSANGNISSFHGFDGSNWVSIAGTTQSFTNSRLSIWAGGSAAGFPNLDLAQLDVVASNVPNRVLYQLLNPPAGATITTNGIIMWTPDETQGPATYLITTVASDLSNPPLMTTNSFSVTVNGGAVLITGVVVNNSGVIVTWNSISNRTYRMQFRSNLTDAGWVDLPPDVTATGPSASKTNSPVTLPQSFYRVVLLP